MTDPDVIRLRVSRANREALERGIPVTFLRIALGIDGVHELYIEGHGPVPLPDCSQRPAVPLKREDPDGD